MWQVSKARKPFQIAAVDEYINEKQTHEQKTSLISRGIYHRKKIVCTH